jgi:hypothetical protein
MQIVGELMQRNHKSLICRFLLRYVFFLKIQLFSAIMNKGIICPEAGKKYSPLFLHVTARPAVGQN